MFPDEQGYYGSYGGRFVPETLIPCLEATEKAYHEAMADPEFKRELGELLARYVGRPSPLSAAPRLSSRVGGAAIYLKREDLNHTGSHKINNTIGQALLAQKMGKRRLIAETGAGQHGVAAATAAAMLGLECRVFMGAKDVERQRLNVFRMKMLGAEVYPVYKGSQTLKDATNEAFRDFIASFEDSQLVAGSVVGPHPYPLIVRDLQSVIGHELREQCLAYLGRFPDLIVACVGGGSNAIGAFYPFIDTAVHLVGVEAGGIDTEAGHHCSTLNYGSDGVLHGAFSKLLQDKNGQVLDTHSIAAGLDYPGVGPEHAYLHSTGRVRYIHVNDQQALEAFELLCRLEGIVPALESAHAVAGAIQLAAQMSPKQSLIINISGRGDKDVETVAALLGGKNNA